MKQTLRLQNLKCPRAGLRKKLSARKAVSFAFCLVALLFSNILQAQTTVTITGTSAATATYHAGPIYRSSASSAYDASRYSYLFTAAELTAAGIPNGAIITKVAWNKTNNATTTANASGIFDIYIKNSVATDFTAASVPWSTQITGATKVYTTTSQTIPAAIGWLDFPLTTTYNYTGGALEISTDWDINQATGNPTSAAINWEVSNAADRIYGISDTGTPTANLSSTSNSIGTLTDLRPNIQITFISSPCTAPPTAGTAVASVANICANQNFSLSLTGVSLGLGQTYQWETSSNGTSGWTSVGSSSANLGLTTTQTVGTHYYRATVTCSGQTSYSTPVSVTSPALISGNFTINKNAPATSTNFQTFASALNSLSCGIGGPVVFNVVAGTGPYSEQVTITPISGASATNSITFNGNGNTISASPVSGTRHIFKLDDADYVTIDNFMIETDAAASYGWGIHFLNDANNNTISNNTITIGTTSTTSSSSAGIVFANSNSTITTVGNTGNNNIITGNTITGGYRGIRINSAAAGTGNNQIINNTIKDFYSAGIELDDANGTLIENNNISRPGRAAVTTFEGITLSGTTKNTVISKNRIHSTHSGATTKTGTAYGIYSSSNDAPVGSENIVKNNLIYNFTNTGTAYGINNTGSNGGFYYHNTISLDNPAATGNTRGLYQSTAASNIKFINNIVSITAGAPFASKRALYFNTVGSDIISNNNALYVPNGAMGYYNGVTYATLSDWQIANTTAPFDANSVSANPHFVNAATGNFQPTAFALNNIGQPLAAVTTDFTGATRNAATPDPGAYEFSLPANDAGITAITTPASGCGLTATENVTITVFNFGTTALNNVPVSYTLNNGTPVTGVVPGPIAPGTSVNFTFSTAANLAATGSYTLTVSTTLGADALAYNDAMTTTIHSLPVISTFPYNQDFETGNGSWIASGRNSSWALGTPAGTIINSAGSGSNSWVTNLTGNHPAYESSAVSSPCFNFTSVPNPGISMKIWWEIEDDWDGAVLQSSIDGGATWQVVGNFGDPNNWYNADSIDANPGNQLLTQNGRFIGWSGTGTAGSGGWVTASHALTGLGGQANVRLRIAFASDLFTEEEGFAFDDISISNMLTAPTVATGGPTTFCQGGSVVLTATSNTPGATFAWQLNGTPITGATASTYTANAAGSYTVVATSGTASATSAPVVVTVNQPAATPTITAGGPTALCTGGSVVLTAASTTSGATFQWFENGVAIATGTTSTFTANAAGSYTVVATANGCPSPASAATTVTLNPTPVTPTITAAGATTICDGDTIDLTAATTTSGATFQWFMNGTAITGATAAILKASDAGSYTVEAIANGCTSAVSAATTITVNPLPATPTITQQGGTLTSSAATGNQWYRNGTAITGATGQVHVTTTNGAYTVIVTGTNGCPSEPSAIVNVTNTGMKDALAGMHVEVYPNPTSSSFNVKLNGYQKDATLVLYNLAGQQIIADKATADGQAKNINIQGLAAGTYLLKVTSDKGMQVTRLIVQ